MSWSKIGCSIYENVCVSAIRFNLQRENIGAVEISGRKLGERDKRVYGCSTRIESSLSVMKIDAFGIKRLADIGIGPKNTPVSAIC